MSSNLPFSAAAGTRSSWHQGNGLLEPWTHKSSICECSCTTLLLFLGYNSPPASIAFDSTSKCLVVFVWRDAIYLFSLSLEVMFLPKISKAFEMFRSTYGCFCLQMRCLGRMPPFFHCPETVKRCHHNRWQPLPRHFLLALSEQTVITGKSSEVSPFVFDCNNSPPSALSASGMP